MTRTDIHRPSVLNPDEYSFVGFECLPKAGHDPVGWAWVQKAEREAIQAHMAMTGGSYSTHAHGGVCMVCGCANAIYTALFYHEPTNVYVRVGRICADQIEMGDIGFDAFIEKTRNALKRRAGQKKAEAWLTEAGIEDAWGFYQDADAGDTDGFRYEEHTIVDIVSKLVRYGSISDRQENYLRVLLDKIANREKIEKQRAKEMADADPAPTGRVEVAGEVLALKYQDYGFHGVLKMLLKTDGGWKLWATVPSAADRLERGDRISVRVTVEPSKDDPKFAFGKRPHLLGVDKS